MTETIEYVQKLNEIRFMSILSIKNKDYLKEGYQCIAGKKRVVFVVLVSI